MERRPLLKTQKISLIFWLSIIALTIVFIFSNSIKYPIESAKASGIVSEFLSKIFNPNGNIPEDIFHRAVRKLAHFSEFALLGAELTFFKKSLLKNFFDRYAIYVPAIILLIAVIDEFIQRFVERGSSLTDVMIDFCGGIAGIIFAVIVCALADKIFRKEKEKAE